MPGGVRERGDHNGDPALPERGGGGPLSAPPSPALRPGEKKGNGSSLFRGETMSRGRKDDGAHLMLLQDPSVTETGKLSLGPGVFPTAPLSGGVSVPL